MALHFISDLHLDPARPQLRALFLQYLQGPAREAQALYILGDLFEVWADDDVSAPLYTTEIAAIAALSRSGVAVHFVCGNRDFLCGAEFARQAGLQLAIEPLILHHGAHHCALMHGDVLCTDDVGYQRFRRVVRWPWLQRLYRALPARSKLAVARALRGQTREHTRMKAQDILDVNGTAVANFYAAHPQCNVLIHGHTHRPADHAVRPHKHRLVLADWSDVAGEYLVLDKHGWQRQAVRIAA